MKLLFGFGQDLFSQCFQTLDAMTTKQPLARVDLAYKKIVEFSPEQIELIKSSREVDLSGNTINDLSALRDCTQIEILVLDENALTSNSRIPKLPKLDTLWVNKNKIANLAVFIDKLVERAPQLKYLSMLNNDACPNYFNGGTPKQYNDYRLYVVNRMRNLKNLDNVEVTDQERQEADKIYGKLALTKTSDESRRKDNLLIIDYFAKKEEEEKTKKLEMSKRRKEREERKRLALLKKEEERRKALEEKKKARLRTRKTSDSLQPVTSVTPVTSETTHVTPVTSTPALDLPSLDSLSLDSKTDSRPELLVPAFPQLLSFSSGTSPSLYDSADFVEVPLNQSRHVPAPDGSFSSLFSRLKSGSSDSEDDDLWFGSSESESEWSGSEDAPDLLPSALPPVSQPIAHDADEWSSDDD